MFHRFHTGTWQRRPSGRVPTRFIPVRVARATVTMAVLRICALLLLFDCQEAFHCCLVVACINRINMISIECHRSGERCPGKREFDNRIEINRVRSGEIMWLFPLREAPTSALCMYTLRICPDKIPFLIEDQTFLWLANIMGQAKKTMLYLGNEDPKKPLNIF